VYPESNSFYCFGCGAGGDGVSFLMRMERLDYIEAVKALSQRVGMQLPEDQYDDGLAQKRRRILAANREAARFFHGQLREPGGRAGLQYWLEGRGLAPQTVKHFGLGYAPASWDALLTHMRRQGYAPEELVDANLASRSQRDGRTHYFDRFRGRAMVPILDLRGNVLAFGGRVLDDQKPKYINTSDTLAYKKGRDIYALNFAKNEARGRLILVEGYMDVIALHQAGFPQAVACLGTALTREQALLLARYADEVALSYDADEAGQAATQKALHILSQTNLKLRVIRLSGGKDPDEIVRTFGAERYRQLLEGAANDIEYRLLRARGNLDLETANGKRDYLAACANILAGCNAVEKELYAARLAEELSVNKQAILDQIPKKKRREQGAYLEEKKSLQQFYRQIHPSYEKNMALTEERLLSLLLWTPDFYRKARDKLTAAQFVTPLYQQAAEKLFARLEQGQGIEPELLTGLLTEAELNAVMKCLHSPAGQLAQPWQEFLDCIQKLQAEQTSLALQRADKAQMDDAAYLRLFQRNNGGT
jgi:DNA primase